MVSTLLAASAITQANPGADITVYNGGFGLIKETRTIDLQKGVNTVTVEGVAEFIEVNSVFVQPVAGAHSFVILEQNYQYDLISPIAILNKVVGGTIILNRVLPDGNKERLVCTLLSSPTAIVGRSDGSSSYTWNGMVVRTEDGRILLNPSGEVEVEKIPGGLISKPTLFWLIDSTEAGSKKVDMSYLARNMSWNADYILSLENSGTVGDIKGWVTLTNNSGGTWPKANLKLLAGEVKREYANMPRGGGFGGGGIAMQNKAGFVEEAFAEYHLYTLPRPTDVVNKEIKQVSLLEGSNVKVTKRLVFDFYKSYYYMPDDVWNRNGQQPFENPAFLIEFMNSEENNMGMPLPEGNFKVYQKDSSGSSQLLGEQRIKHTPRNEKISLYVGQAFDVVASRKRTEFRWLHTNHNLSTSTFEIEVRNRKKEATTVQIIERHWGEVNVTESNIDPEELDANTFQFTMTLKPDEVKTLRYTVITKHP